MAEQTTSCTRCGDVDTVTVDGVHGRRCATCPPGLDPVEAAKLAAHGLPGTAGAYIRAHLPAGCFRHDLADHLVDLGRADSAFTYLRAHMARETDQRFAAASQAIGGVR